MNAVNILYISDTIPPQSNGPSYQPTDKISQTPNRKIDAKALKKIPQFLSFPKLLYHCENTAKGSKVNVYPVYISSSGVMLLLSSVRFTLLCKSKCSKPQAKLAC